MVRTLSLTTSQIDALTSSNSTILYNAQQRGVTLYGGTDLASNITQLEINNSTGSCLTLRHDSSTTNYTNFNLSSGGVLNIDVSGGSKSINIVNHNGSTQGLMLNNTLVIATASELNQLSGLTSSLTNINKLDVTDGTASAGKALVTDENNNISGINDLSTNNLTVNGTLVTASATELNYTDISTAGTAQAAKALIVDVNRNITNINNLTASQLTGTLQTASQPNITSVGTLGDLSVTNEITADTINVSSLILDGVDISTAVSNSNGLDGIIAGTVSAGKALVVDSNKDLTGMHDLTSNGTITASTLTGTTLTGTLSTAAQPNITSVGTLSNLSVTGNVSGTLTTASQPNITSVGTLSGLVASGDVNISSHNGTTVGLKLNGTLVTAQASDLNKLPNITSSATELNYLAGVSPGTVGTSKAIVTDGNKDISGVRNVTMTGAITGATGVTATTLTGTLATAAQPNITSVGTLNDLNVTNEITADTVNTTSLVLNGNDISTSLSNVSGLDGVSPGIVTASKVLIVDANKDLATMRHLTASGTVTANTLAGTVSTAAQPNITSLGDLSGLTLASDGNITLSGTGTLTGAATVSATTLTGTVSTASQPNITSLGNLSGLTLASNGNVTMSGTGTLSGAASVSATNLTGTIQTASQPNITAVGTLDGLTASSNVNISAHNGTTTGLQLNGTLVTANASEINTLTGVTAGTVSASKAVVVNLNKNVSGINDLAMTGAISGATTVAATTLTGTLSTASQPNITTLAGVTSIGSSGTTLTGTLATASQPNITTLSGVASIGANGSTTLTGTLQTAAQPNVTSVGTLTSLALSGTVSGVTTLTATTLAGTLSTASQPNITTLAGVTSIGASGSTTVTGTLQTASQPNITTLAGVTSIGASGSTTLTGTLQTASQPNITSIGNLTSLTVNGAVSGVTTLGLAGVLTSSNGTASTNNTTGAIRLIGGIAINNTTDATNSTNGGTFTSAGGGAFAKKLFVGSTLSVASDLTVGGNLIVTGTTTSINSTSTNILDNTLILNSGPAGTGYDAGVITKRYQVDNAAGTGDVVNDTAKENQAIATPGESTIILSASASSIDNYYNDWWVRISGGPANNQVRQVSSYVGSTRTLNLKTSLSVSPTSATISLYNKGFTSLHWNETNKRFTTAFTTSDISTGTLSIIDYADFATNNIIGLSTTASTSNTTGAIRLAGGIAISNATDATSSTNGGTFTSAGGGAFAKKLFVGANLTVSSTSSLRTTDAANASVTYPIDVSHFLSSGTAANGIGSGMTFNAPNDAGTIISYGRMWAQASSVAALAHAGTLSFSPVFNGAFANSLSLSATSATKSVLALAGATSSITSYEGIFTNITGTLQTAAQTNITSVGTLTGLTMSGAISGVTTLTATTLTGTLSTASQPNITTLAGVMSIGASGSTTLTGTLQTTSQPNITTLTGVTAVGASDSTTLTGTLQTAAQTNITSVGTLTGLTMSGAISGVTTLTATTLDGTLSTVSQPNITTLDGVTSIGASGSTALTGTLQTAAQTNITSVGTLTSLTMSGAVSGVTTLGSSGVITHSNSTTSTTNANGAMRLAGGISISNVTDAVSSTNGGTFTSAGGGAFAKSLFVGTTLTATTLAGTLSTASQPNITSIGTLSNLNITKSSGGEMLTLTTSVSTVINAIKFVTNSQTYELGTRGGSAADHPGSFYIYNSSFLLTMSNTGITRILNSEDCTSTTTGCLQLTGGLYSAKNIFTSGGLTATNGASFGSTTRITGASTPATGAGLELSYATGKSNIYSFDRTSPGTYKDLNLNDKVTILGSNGFVGLNNNTSPSYRLDFGSTASNMLLNLYGGMYGLGANNSNLQSFSDGGFTWNTVASAVTGTGSAPGTALMILNEIGNITLLGGIGAVGNITSQGTITGGSDYRLKKDVFNIIYGINEIKQLRPVNYSLINNDTKCIGFIAHELQELIPELVIGKKNEIDEDGKPVMQSVDYMHLTAVLVKGIQEQSEQIEVLTDRVTELETKNNNLESRLAVLEAFIANL